MKKIIPVAEYMLLVLATVFLFLIHEQESQTYKDMMFYIALCFIVVLLILLRGVSINTRNIVWAIICVAAVIIYIKYKNINAAYYGEVYHKVVRIRIALHGALAFFIPDLIIHRPKNIREKLTNPLMWLLVLTSLIFLIHEKAVIPILCPLFIFYFTDISREKWVELTDCLVLALYSTFALLFTRSMIFAPDKYEVDGRYAGTFLLNSKAGELCGIALICLLYFFVRWLYSENRKKRMLLVLVPFLLYALYANYIVGGRSALLGVVFAIVCVFVFLHGKGLKSTLIRGGIIGIVAIVSIVGLFALSKYLRVGIESGRLENVSYLGEHIAAMTIEDASKGSFAPGSLANALDFLSSGRLSIWKESAENVILWGSKEGARLDTHNTYVFWYVKYGLICGVALSLWFLWTVIKSLKETVRKNNYIILPLLWNVFIMGFIFTSNEYLESIGIMIFMIMQYPLLNYYNCKEKD